jgi:membrane protein YqaA with SNARE-associated domain
MSLAEGLRSLGLFGVFLASFLGHFSIVLKDVIFVPVFLYVSGFWDPLLLGFVGGVGGGLGELGAYLLGRGVGKLAENKQKVTNIPSWVKKLGLFGVFLSSLTPLPDTPVLMLLGTTRFPVLAVLALEILGKTFLYTSVAVAGGMIYSSLGEIFQAPWDSVIITLASLSLSIIVTWRRTRRPLLRFAEKTINKLRKLKGKPRKL